MYSTYASILAQNQIYMTCYITHLMRNSQLLKMTNAQLF